MLRYTVLRLLVFLGCLALLWLLGLRGEEDLLLLVVGAALLSAVISYFALRRFREDYSAQRGEDRPAHHRQAHRAGRDADRRGRRGRGDVPRRRHLPLSGRAAEVVLVPGLGLDARAWSGVLARLAGLGTVVLLPAMGRPADAGADLRVEAQAARLLDLLPAEGDLVLVGHSASCSVVVEAARHTGVVRGLALVGPTTIRRRRRGRAW